MGLIIAIFIIILLLAGLTSRVVAVKVRAQWVKAGRPRPKLVQGITFALCFLLIFVGIYVLLLYNVMFER